MLDLLGKHIINNKKESKQLAQHIAINLKPNEILVFSGDLGAGKTFFCQNIIKQLCGQQTNVTSPTFNLLQIYDYQPTCSIYHYDLYRLKYLDEIYELGIEEAFTNNICLIEWPEIIKTILPDKTIYIDIKTINLSKREVLISV
ncbi:MAG: tRNA (adenosine(37)-N6)-threonylcarbamoyltransferase complex ATPase subunit type 1 TsaE [Rickettsiales bacterium]|nr:MAG: tRNA (adenosine(37)-N6)-threonylcarbamoyltransferase complex ATPase subunit type 1 TsaE [Rickettsiales bacterium]